MGELSNASMGDSMNSLGHIGSTCIPKRKPGIPWWILNTPLETMDHGLVENFRILVTTQGVSNIREIGRVLSLKSLKATLHDPEASLPWAKSCPNQHFRMLRNAHRGCPMSVKITSTEDWVHYIQCRDWTRHGNSHQTSSNMACWIFGRCPMFSWPMGKMGLVPQSSSPRLGCGFVLAGRF